MALSKKDAPGASAKKSTAVDVEVHPEIDTPSGAAAAKVADITDDRERGEAYAKAKAAKRWGYE